MADRVSLTDFVNNYECKNGQIGSEEILNRAVHQVKLELDRLWTWVIDNSTTLPPGDLNDYIINDSINYTDPDATKYARSANYIGLRISNDFNNINTTDTWCTYRIKERIDNAVVDGGNW